MSIPQNMRAAVIDGNQLTIKEVPVAPLAEKELLVKVKAVAGNPTDWKHILLKIGPQGAICGCDAAGEVVALGPGVDTSKFAVGDTVYGFVHGSSVNYPENGAFAEYAKFYSELTYKAPLSVATTDKLPEGVVKNFETACSLPVSLTTAGAVLNIHLGSKLEWQPAKPQHDFPLLIWGGATGVGQQLIQVAKNLNAYSKIVVVASKKHSEQLKAYGADDIFDYHDADVVEQIRAAYPNIYHAIDGVSNEETIQQVYNSTSRDGSKVKVIQLTVLSIENIKPEDRRPEAEIEGALLYCATGKDVPFGSLTIPANPAYAAACTQVVQFLSPRVANGDIHHIPVKVYQNGLESVNSILDDIRNNKNSGEKLVARL